MVGDRNDLWAWHGDEHAPVEGPAALGGRIGPLCCAMKGAYQRENAALAIAALRILSEFGIECDLPTIQTGLAAVRWPGRLEYSNCPGKPCRILQT